MCIATEYVSRNTTHLHEGPELCFAGSSYVALDGGGKSLCVAVMSVVLYSP